MENISKSSKHVCNKPKKGNIFLFAPKNQNDLFLKRICLYSTLPSLQYYIKIFMQFKVARFFLSKRTNFGLKRSQKSLDLIWQGPKLCHWLKNTFFTTISCKKIRVLFFHRMCFNHQTVALRQLREKDF